MDALERIFGTTKPVIAMLHFPGLPGRPHHDPAAGPDRFVDVVRRDLAILQEAGVDGLLFCNEADHPYQLRVGPEIPAAMAATIGVVRAEVRVPFGVNILWDAIASLALARATGARFIREVLTGVYESDLGMIEPGIGDIAGYRTMIGAADVALFDNICPSSPARSAAGASPSGRKGAAFLGMDAILISGPAAGIPFEMSDLRAAKDGRPGHAGHRQHRRPGRSRSTRSSRVADGVIVGTSLKVDGVTWNPVDPERADRLMEAVRTARARRRRLRLRWPGDPHLLRDGPARLVEVLPQVHQRRDGLQGRRPGARRRRRREGDPDDRARSRRPMALQVHRRDYDVDGRGRARGAGAADRRPRLLPVPGRARASSRRWRRAAASTAFS